MHLDRIFLVASAAAVVAEGTDTCRRPSAARGPRATVGVYANGKKLLTGFKPGSLTDPLKLPEGNYDLKVTAAGKTAVLIQANDVAVPGGANVTAVAHLDAGGKPVLTPFVNDTSKLAAGQARLTVRHTAAAPPANLISQDYRIVDVSLEPNDGNPVHSRDSVVRGTLPA